MFDCIGRDSDPATLPRRFQAVAIGIVTSAGLAMLVGGLSLWIGHDPEPLLTDEVSWVEMIELPDPPGPEAPPAAPRFSDIGDPGQANPLPDRSYAVPQEQSRVILTSEEHGQQGSEAPDGDGSEGGLANVNGRASGEGPVVVHHSQLTILKKVRPRYPASALSAGLGEVRCEAAVEVGLDGRVGKVRITSCAPQFVSETRRALSRWVFRPYTIDGRPVVSQARIAVIYTVD